MPRDLRDRVIIITGASSGIGEATAVACAKAGMHIVITARREERLRALAGVIEGLGRRAVAVPGDVVEPDLSLRLLDAAHREFGDVHAVFANAGYALEKPLVTASDQEIRQMFDVNFFSGLDLLQQAGRRWIQQDRPGHLLMCSSAVGKFTLPYYGLYSATKAAQSMACRAMRLELEHHGIEVSCVHPISTRTEFTDVVTRLSHPLGSRGEVAEHSPSMFVQSPHRVADAVVKCLRHPVPEVWTSFLTRLGAAIMTLSPRFGDFAMRRIRNKIETPRPELKKPA